MIPFGKTKKGTVIESYEFGSGPEVLILGGVHGDEVEGVVATKSLIEESPALKLKLTVVPEFNTDGVSAGTRVNAQGVDLNRNLPTKDWNPEAFNKRYPPGPHPNSETENQALTQFIETRKPVFVFSMHSFTKFLLNTNGDCQEEAQIIHGQTGYPIEPSMGYPTPGCLGTYCGLERNIPTITYELERGMDHEKIKTIHVPAVLKALQHIEEKHGRY